MVKKNGLDVYLGRFCFYDFSYKAVAPPLTKQEIAAPLNFRGQIKHPMMLFT